MRISATSRHRERAAASRRRAHRRLHARGRHPQRRLDQGPRGRDRDHRRPQRRRQVDPDQDDLRPARPARGPGSCFHGRGHRGRARRTPSPARDSATSPSSTTSSRASRVEENLEMGSLDRSQGHRDEQIERMYELFPRLCERRSQPAGTMSGGERQMVAMARALMPDPQAAARSTSPRPGWPRPSSTRSSRRRRRSTKAGVTILMVEQNARRALWRCPTAATSSTSARNRFEGPRQGPDRGPQGRRAVPAAAPAASTRPRISSRRGRGRVSRTSVGPGLAAGG